MEQLRFLFEDLLGFQLLPVKQGRNQARTSVITPIRIKVFIEQNRYFIVQLANYNSDTGDSILQSRVDQRKYESISPIVESGMNQSESPI